jgi:ribose/xylose/arabinose/galactoside ABC-type transport system permease subunit
MSGALVLQLIQSLLQAQGLGEPAQLIILGVVLLVLISIYGRQRAFRL